MKCVNVIKDIRPLEDLSPVLQFVEYIQNLRPVVISVIISQVLLFFPCEYQFVNELIHGQVVVAWRRHLCYDAICIVDNEIANDAFMSQVLHLAAPAEVPVSVVTVQRAVDALAKTDAAAILVLVKAPQTALSLVQAGVEVEHINVGNLGSAPGRKRAW